MNNELGDAPIQAKHVRVMNTLASMLDEIFNGGARKAERKTGFILMVFPFDDIEGQGRVNYISNANRKDVIILLKEQLKRFEGQPELKGHA